MTEQPCAHCEGRLGKSLEQDVANVETACESVGVDPANHKHFSACRHIRRPDNIVMPCAMTVYSSASMVSPATESVDPQACGIQAKDQNLILTGLYS